MKNLFSLILLLTFCSSAKTFAKPANAIWYLLCESANSVHDDGIISVDYEFYTKYAEPELGSVGPIPTINLKITNKTENDIYIDLKDSYILRNNDATSLYSGIICISAHGTKTLQNIPVFIPACVTTMGNIFYFQENICLSRKFDSLRCGDIKSYNENSTLFTIGGYVTYSFNEDMTDSKFIQTTYYVNKMIGSKWNKLAVGIVSNPSAREIKEVDKVFPQWRNSEYKVIRLWAM